MALLSGFGLGHVRKYAPSTLTLSALYLILRAKSQIIENSPNVAPATLGEFSILKKSSLFHLSYVGLNYIDCIVAQALILIDDIKVVY